MSAKYCTCANPKIRMTFISLDVGFVAVCGACGKEILDHASADATEKEDAITFDDEEATPIMAWPPDSDWDPTDLPPLPNWLELDPDIDSLKKPH